MIAAYYDARTLAERSERMRGPDDQNSDMFSYVVPEARVRADHPLRPIRQMTDEVFAALSPQFTTMYSDMGRPSIPPEQLLRALLLQYLYTIRSERLLMEEIDYSVLFRWFIGLGMDDLIWSPTTFSKNRDRLLTSDVAAAFFDAVVDQARPAPLLWAELFTVEGTLFNWWASLKSFRRKDEDTPPPPDDPGNPTVNFHGESRRNDTHQSTTDPDAWLARKGPGREAKLSYAGHVLLDNRHGLVSNVCVTAATGTAERDAALWLWLKRHARQRSARTRGMTWRALSPLCARAASPHTSRGRPRRVRSTIGRHITTATRSVNSGASSSSKSSGG